MKFVLRVSQWLRWPMIWLPPRLILAIPWPKWLLVTSYDGVLSVFPRRENVTTKFGRSLYCDTKDLIQRRIYMFREWEPAVTTWFTQQVKPGDVILDVGANIGYFSLLAQQLSFPGGQVIAVEASPKTFRSLMSNVELNGLNSDSALELHQVAAAEQRGIVHLYQGRPGNTGQSSTLMQPGFTDEGEVMAIPLSELISEPNKVKLIKIDIEGDELACLRGLIPVLEKMMPVRPLLPRYSSIG